MKTKKTPKSVSQTMVQACDIFNVFQIIKHKKKTKDASSLKKKSLVQRFSTVGDFYTQGTLGNVWRHSCLSQEGPLVKSNGREARKPSILQLTGTAPTAKNPPVPKCQ